jgi:hypothetical protein
LTDLLLFKDLKNSIKEPCASDGGKISWPGYCSTGQRG